MILENGIKDVSSSDPNSMKVADYSHDEVIEDENAVDWEQALDEVENGEKIKADKERKLRQQTHKDEIDRERKKA